MCDLIRSRGGDEGDEEDDYDDSEGETATEDEEDADQEEEDEDDDEGQEERRESSEEEEERQAPPPRQPMVRSQPLHFAVCLSIRKNELLWSPLDGKETIGFLIKYSEPIPCCCAFRAREVCKSGNKTWALVSVPGFCQMFAQRSRPPPPPPPAAAANDDDSDDVVCIDSD